MKKAIFAHHRKINQESMELSEQELILNTAFTITSADTDMEARLRPGALTNLLIQSAIRSAEKLGFGFGGIRRQQLFWVLSRLSLEVYRPLKWNETVQVETWPKDVERIIYLRDFILRDGNEEIVARATSGWLAIDLHTKRPKRIEGLDAEIFRMLKSKSAMDESPERLSELNDGEIFESTSRFFDIDLNKHVTATRYIDWMMDSFPLEFNLSNYPKKIVINYLKETMPEEKLEIIRKQQDEKAYCFEGTNKTSNSKAFRAKFVF